MPTNIYDQGAQAQFINTYAPVPFQEILQAGQSRQQRYDVNKSAFDTMAEQAESLKAIPTSADEAYMSGTVIPTIKELSDVYGTKDYGDPEIMREIHKTLQSKIDRRLVSNMQSSYQNWMQDQQNIAKLKASGKYAPYLETSYRDYSTETGGIYTQSTPAALDYETPATNYFKDIKDSQLTGIDSTGKYYVGVGSNKIKQVAQEQIGSYLQSPAGRQKIQEYRYRTGDSQTPDETIAYNYLLDVGQRYTRRNVKFDPTYGRRPDKDKVPTESISFDLPTQPTEFTGLSWKKLNKNTDEYESKKTILESSLRVAELQGQPNIAQNIQGQLNDLDDEYSAYTGWKDQINASMRDSFDKNIKTIIQNFRADLNKETSNNTEAASKWETSLTNVLNKTNFVFDESTITRVKEEYKNNFGEDSDYESMTEVAKTGPKTSKISRLIFKNTKPLEQLNKTLEKEAEKEFNALKTKGLVESTILLPTTVRSKDQDRFPEWALFGNTIQNTPGDFEVTPVSSDDIKRKKASNLVKDFTKAEDISLISASSGDTKSPFIYVKATFTDKKGENPESYGYKIRIKKADQARAIGATYMKQGNMVEGLRWYNPDISVNVEKAFKLNQEPETISQTIGNQPVTFRKTNDGYYLLGEPGQKRYTSKEQIKAKLYAIYSNAIGLKL